MMGTTDSAGIVNDPANRSHTPPTPDYNQNVADPAIAALDEPAEANLAGFETFVTDAAAMLETLALETP